MSEGHAGRFPPRCRRAGEARTIPPGPPRLRGSPRHPSATFRSNSCGKRSGEGEAHRQCQQEFPYCGVLRRGAAAAMCWGLPGAVDSVAGAVSAFMGHAAGTVGTGSVSVCGRLVAGVPDRTSGAGDVVGRAQARHLVPASAQASVSGRRRARRGVGTGVSAASSAARHRRRRQSRFRVVRRGVVAQASPWPSRGRIGSWGSACVPERWSRARPPGVGSVVVPCPPGVAPPRHYRRPAGRCRGRTACWLGGAAASSPAAAGVSAGFLRAGLNALRGIPVRVRELRAPPPMPAPA